MKRYIFQKSPSEFYFEEFNHIKLIDGDIIHFATPIGDYDVGDLITFDYGLLMGKGYDHKTKKEVTINLQRTYKIDEIVPLNDSDFFKIGECGLQRIKSHYFDHTRLSADEQANITIIDTRQVQQWH